MIRTKYDLKIEVDEREFDLVVREPNTKDKEELKALSGERAQLQEERNAMSAKLFQKSEAYKINKELISALAIFDTTKKEEKKDEKNEKESIFKKIGQKATLLWEQKELNKEIYALQEQIKAHDELANSADITMEDLYAKRFEMLVSGRDKEELRKTLNDGGVSYRDLFVEIGNLVLKAKEKK